MQVSPFPPLSNLARVIQQTETRASNSRMSVQFVPWVLFTGHLIAISSTGRRSLEKDTTLNVEISGAIPDPVTIFQSVAQQIEPRFPKALI